MHLTRLTFRISYCPLILSLITSCSGNLVGVGYLVPIQPGHELPTSVPQFSRGPQFKLGCNYLCLIKRKLFSKLAEIPIDGVVTPIAFLYTGALLWKEFTRETAPRRLEKKETTREEEKELKKERREKARRETMKKEQKLELAREIMGIHADILRLLAYTTAAGTQTLELANNVRKDLGIRVPGLGRTNGEKKEKPDSKILVKENSLGDLSETLTRLRKLQKVLAHLEQT